MIAADGEMRASKALREASNIIEQSPAALQLRYLQVTRDVVLIYLEVTFNSGHTPSGNTCYCSDTFR